MPNSYELYDAQFSQFFDSESAADALYLTLGTVPAGKIWTLRACCYNPNVAETRTICFSIIPRGSSDYVMISVPRSIALSTSLRLPIFAEGDELVLHEGEQLRITRDAATAGSTMRVRALYIETDRPYYREADKHKELRRASPSSKIETFLRSRAAASGSPSRGPGSMGSGGGGRGPTTPI